jgi:hypothetical protein
MISMGKELCSVDKQPLLSEPQEPLRLCQLNKVDKTVDELTIVPILRYGTLFLD